MDVRIECTQRAQKKCVKDAIAEDTIAITHDNDLQLMEGMVN
jgi:hypothetical protein